MAESPLRINSLIPYIGKYHKRTASVVVILSRPDGAVLVVKAHYKAYWSFPGGLIDDGETPLQAGVREVREEVGVAIQQDMLRFALIVDRESTHMRTYQFVFECSVNEAQAKNIKMDTKELTDYAFVTKEDILGRDKRTYSQTARHWAAGARGYEEQVFGAET